MTEGVGTGGDNIYALGPDSTVIQRRPLPLHWAALLALYLILAFAIMIAAKLIPVDHQAKLFFGKIGLDRIHDVFFRYSVAGGVIVPLIFFIEYCCVGWQKSSVRSILVQNPASGRSDFVCFLLNHLRLLRLPQIVLTFGLALITGEMVRAYFGRYFPAILSSDYLPQYVLYPVYFILYTILDYWRTRVDHSVYFWPLHRFHHAAEEFNVLTADRGHPASAFVQSTVKIFPLALLGVPPRRADRHRHAGGRDQLSEPFPGSIGISGGSAAMSSSRRGIISCITA
ncbi:MAG: sterol desaturase family protein [Aliidongia sp.]